MKKAKKRWLSAWDECDLCHIPLKNNVPYFVDGATIYGPWALMCPECHERGGKGLGLGRGQKYDGKTAVLIEGDR